MCWSVVIYLPVSEFMPTSDYWRGGGAQSVTRFTAAQLQLEGVELELGSIQQLLGPLVYQPLFLQLPLCIHQLNL